LLYLAHWYNDLPLASVTRVCAVSAAVVYYKQVVVARDKDGGHHCFLRVHQTSESDGPSDTVGASDALFASFVHYWIESVQPLDALECAVAFAGWKIGESGGAQGFASPTQVEALVG
jgi:sugar/nucleoside kinase (ribokinase family)